MVSKVTTSVIVEFVESVKTILKVLNEMDGSEMLTLTDLKFTLIPVEETAKGKIKLKPEHFFDIDDIQSIYLLLIQAAVAGNIIEVYNIEDGKPVSHDIFIRWTDNISLGTRNIGKPGFEWCWGGDF